MEVSFCFFKTESYYFWVHKLAISPVFFFFLVVVYFKEHLFISLRMFSEWGLHLWITKYFIFPINVLFFIYSSWKRRLRLFSVLYHFIHSLSKYLWMLTLWQVLCWKYNNGQDSLPTLHALRVYCAIREVKDIPHGKAVMSGRYYRIKRLWCQETQSRMSLTWDHEMFNRPSR